MKKLNKLASVDFRLHVIQETRVITLSDAVDKYTVDNLITYLEYLSSFSKLPITIRISSPGGSVDHGLVLYDYIKSSKVPIYTKCSGLAASMAAVLLASGKRGHRTATKHARIMIHQPSSGYIGKALDIENHAKETSRIRKLLNTILSQDTKQPYNKIAKDTELDFWMTAEEAKAYGIIDKII